MDETTIAVATADVMVYDDGTKRWTSPDGCAETCRSQVRILRNTRTNTFRIVGTRIQDREWILNCNIYERLKYNAATPTFHQWRDEKRKVYGLSFVAEDDARVFVNVMTQAITILSSANNDYQNGSELGLSNGVYHEPQQLHHNAHSAPSFRDADQDSICSSTATTATLNANNYRKSSQSIQSSSSGGVALLSSAQRRASQGSSTSSGSSNTTTNTIYATTALNINNNTLTSSLGTTTTQSSHLNSPSRIPPAPPPPPPLSQLTTGGSRVTSSSTNSQYLPHHAQTHSLPNNTINTNGNTSNSMANGGTPQAPPLPPGGIAAIITNAPPAPPPPPSTLSSSKGGGISIAEQIKRVQLRKTSAPAISANNSTNAQQNRNDNSGGGNTRGGGRGDLFSELEATLNKRKNNAENVVDGKSIGDGTIKASTRHAAWEKPLASVTAMNGSNATNTAGSVLDSPKNHRSIGRAPSGSSISSQDEQQPSRSAALMLNGQHTHVNNSNTIGNASSSTNNDALIEKLKSEILSEMRTEIEKAKCEIIEALRAELQQKR